MRRVALFVRKSSEEAATPFLSAKETLTLGRGDDVDLKLDHRSVSLHHATLRHRGDHCTLTDEGSRNGTVVGQVPLAPLRTRLVRPGDLIRLGNVWLELQMPVDHGEEAPTTGELALALMSGQLRDHREPHLTVAEGDDFGLELPFNEMRSEVTIGSAKACDLVLRDPKVRAKHVSIARRSGSFFARAHDSISVGVTNVLPGDEIEWFPRHMMRVGETVLALEVPAERAKVVLSDPVIAAAMTISAPNTDDRPNVADAIEEKPLPREASDGSPTVEAPGPSGDAPIAPMASFPELRKQPTRAAGRIKPDHLVIAGVVLIIALALGALFVVLRSG